MFGDVDAGTRPGPDQGPLVFRIIIIAVAPSTIALPLGVEGLSLAGLELCNSLAQLRHRPVGRQLVLRAKIYQIRLPEDRVIQRGLAGRSHLIQNLGSANSLGPGWAPWPVSWIAWPWPERPGHESLPSRRIIFDCFPFFPRKIQAKMFCRHNFLLDSLRENVSGIFRGYSQISARDFPFSSSPFVFIPYALRVSPFRVFRFLFSFSVRGLGPY